MDQNIFKAFMQIEVVNNGVNEIIKTMESDKNEEVIKYCFAYCSEYIHSDTFFEHVDINASFDIFSIVLNEATDFKYGFETEFNNGIQTISIDNENMEININSIFELFDIIGNESLGIDLNPNNIYMGESEDGY